MKLKIINLLILMFISLQLVLPVALLAVEIAPRISDREIIEKLAILEAGQGALRSEMKAGQDALAIRLTDLRSEMKSGQEALRSEMKSGQEALGQRLDDVGQRLNSSNNTMLVLFASLITLIVALFGYIAWDRRTMVKPVVEQLHRLEHGVVVDVVDDLDLHNPEGSLLARQLRALREYAQINPEFAEVMRGLTLL